MLHFKVYFKVYIDWEKKFTFDISYSVSAYSIWKSTCIISNEPSNNHISIYKITPWWEIELLWKKIKIIINDNNLYYNPTEEEIIESMLKNYYLHNWFSLDWISNKKINNLRNHQLLFQKIHFINNWSALAITTLDWKYHISRWSKNGYIESEFLGYFDSAKIKNTSIWANWEINVYITYKENWKEKYWLLVFNKNESDEFYEWVYSFMKFDIHSNIIGKNDISFPVTWVFTKPNWNNEFSYLIKWEEFDFSQVIHWIDNIEPIQKVPFDVLKLINWSIVFHVDENHYYNIPERIKLQDNNFELIKNYLYIFDPNTLTIREIRKTDSGNSPNKKQLIIAGKIGSMNHININGNKLITPPRIFDYIDNVSISNDWNYWYLGYRVINNNLILSIVKNNKVIKDITINNAENYFPNESGNDNIWEKISTIMGWIFLKFSDDFKHYSIFYELNGLNEYINDSYLDWEKMWIDIRRIEKFSSNKWWKTLIPYREWNWPNETRYFQKDNKTEKTNNLILSHIWDFHPFIQKTFKILTKEKLDEADLKFILQNSNYPRDIWYNFNLETYLKDLKQMINEAKILLTMPDIQVPDIIKSDENWKEKTEKFIKTSEEFILYSNSFPDETDINLKKRFENILDWNHYIWKPEQIKEKLENLIARMNSIINPDSIKVWKKTYKPPAPKWIANSENWNETFQTFIKDANKYLSWNKEVLTTNPQLNKVITWSYNLLFDKAILDKVKSNWLSQIVQENKTNLIVLIDIMTKLWDFKANEDEWKADVLYEITKL